MNGDAKSGLCIMKILNKSAFKKHCRHDNLEGAFLDSFAVLDERDHYCSSTNRLCSGRVFCLNSDRKSDIIVGHFRRPVS